MDQCPYCERRFEQITDFPKMKVISGGLLGERQLFKAIQAKYSERLGTEAMVDIEKDIDTLLKSNDAIKKFSKTLEDAVGKETRVKDLLPAWVFSADNVPGAENYKITVTEAEPKKEARVTDIILFKQSDAHLYAGTYMELLKIGEIVYEGLINR